eukprot:SAG31_NODE_16742_length_698_cov_0.607679_1_plen_215_part_01
MLLLFVLKVGRSYQPVIVDRNDPESRKTAKESIIQRAHDNTFPPVLIFPEGTCTNGRGLISFKYGAFYPGSPIQACCVSFPYCSWFGGFDPSYTAAGPGMGEILLRLMAQVFSVCSPLCYLVPRVIVLLCSPLFLFFVCHEIVFDEPTAPCFAIRCASHQPFNRMKVQFLPLIIPTVAEASSPRHYSTRVRDAMAKKLGVAMTQHAYEDSRLMTK